MRPKFTLANLLLLTAIFAMGAQMYRNHIQFQELEVELALHKAVRAQAFRVRQRELELHAIMHQIKPDFEMALLYRWAGFGDQLPVNVAEATNTQPIGLELTPAIGTRRAATQVRNAELQLLRERDRLQHLEHELNLHVGD